MLKKAIGQFKAHHNPLYHHLFNVCCFVLMGKLYFKIKVSWTEIALGILSAVVTEAILQKLINKKTQLLRPAAFISSISMMVMLRASYVWIYPLVSAVGIIQKYIFRQKDGSHLFNPSNFSIVFALALFPSLTYLDTESWGQAHIFIGLVIASATILMLRTHKLLNSLIFFGSFSIFYHYLVLDSWVSLHTILTTTPYILFGTFILNDPKTAPRLRPHLYAFAIATITFNFLFLLLLGQKSLNLPLSMLIASIIYRSCDHFFTDQKKIPQIIFAITLLTSILVFFGLKNSQYNLMGNMEESLSRNTLKQLNAINPAASKQEFPYPFNAPTRNSSVVLTNKEYKNLFKSNYQDSFEDMGGGLFKRKIRSSPSQIKKFEPVSNIISRSEAPTSLSQLGEDHAYYAGIALLNFNNDTLPDVLLANTTGPTRLFVNQGNHQFIEVTDHAFKTPSIGIENFFIGDFNNDGFSDILAVHNQSDKRRPNGIYFFNSETKQFQFKEINGMGREKKQSGSIGAYDVNHDGVLDFYISYAVEWLEIKPTRPRFSDEFWISYDGTWKDEYQQWIGNAKEDGEMSGMTVNFSSLKPDSIQMLLGNDFDDPSMIFDVKKDKLIHWSKDIHRHQSVESMNFFPTDFNNDGKMEIWEGAIQNRSDFKHSKEKLIMSSTHETSYSKEMKDLILSSAYNRFDCKKYTNSYVKAYCQFQIMRLKAKMDFDLGACESQLGPYLSAVCKVEAIVSNRGYLKPRDNSPYNPDKHGRLFAGNVILQNNNGHYENVINEEASNTGWAWGGISFDYNNDSLMDIFVTGNHTHWFQGHNFILINQTKDDKIFLKDMSKELEVDYSGEYRGVVSGDMDESCQGAVLSNNYIGSPMYLKNQMGGNCIKVDLEDKMLEGATVKINLESGRVLTRQIYTGGYWCAHPGKTLYFGISSRDIPQNMIVKWADGKETQYQNILKDHHYYIKR